MAAARDAELAHRAEQDEPSPIAGVAYDARRGEMDLLHLVDTPTDELMTTLTGEFASSGSEDRARLRSSLTMDDFYTVMTYTRRMVIRALREENASPARQAVLALAMIDRSRIDWRDLSLAAGLLSFTLARLSSDVNDDFSNAVALAEPGTAELLTQHGASPSRDLTTWGFRLVTTADGVGLVGDEGQPFAPKADLIMVADRLRRTLDDKTWTAGPITSGSSLPAVWFRSRPVPEDAMKGTTGCVKMNCYIADASQESKAQMLLIFIVEASSPTDAEAIAEAAGSGQDSTFVEFGVFRGVVSAVLISRSFVKGVNSLETAASIDRFRGSLEECLAGAT